MSHPTPGPYQSYDQPSGPPSYGPPPGPPSYGPPSYGPPSGPPPTKKGAGLAIASMVLGIIALLLSWIPSSTTSPRSWRSSDSGWASPRSSSPAGAPTAARAWRSPAW